MSFETQEQVSAGGVVFRRHGRAVEVALISVGEKARWQLPKGLVGGGESPEQAALREVREETGLDGELVAPIETIEYWYVGGGARAGTRVRFHKFVHFYLLRYAAGEPSDHDHEVNEARWIEIAVAAGMLAFKGERAVLRRAREMIENDGRGMRDGEVRDKQSSFQF
ncbi:MAG TPA: NUDIX hydrolase [Pyrinomonadaceae bacterium]